MKKFNIDTNQFTGTIETQEQFDEVKKRLDNVGNDIYKTKMNYDVMNDVPTFGFNSQCVGTSLKTWLERN